MLIANTIYGDWGLLLHIFITATAAFALGRTSIPRTAAVAFSLVVAFIASLGWGMLTAATAIVWREMFDPRESLCSVVCVVAFVPAQGGEVVLRQEWRWTEAAVAFAVQVIVAWVLPGVVAYLAVTLRRRLFPSPSGKSWAVLGVLLICTVLMLLLTVRFSGEPPF
ncbi:MAG: hypothetical protein WHT09_16725 [Thermogutta sp.]